MILHLFCSDGIQVKTNYFNQCKYKNLDKTNQEKIGVMNGRF